MPESKRDRACTLGHVCEEEWRCGFRAFLLFLMIAAEVMYLLLPVTSRLAFRELITRFISKQGFLNLNQSQRPLWLSDLWKVASPQFVALESYNRLAA
jgi:hypothetical protein